MSAGSIWLRCITAAKLVGLVLLAVYFYRVPIYVEWTWVAAYVGIMLAMALIHALLVNPLLERFFPSQRIDPAPYGTRIIAWTRRRPLRQLALLPGEDGFFFVPLLWYGISPLSAAIAAALFAASHFPQFAVKHCIGKFAALFVIALIVLPHGLATVIVGHVVVDVIAFALGNKLYPEREGDPA